MTPHTRIPETSKRRCLLKVSARVLVKLLERSGKSVFFEKFRKNAISLKRGQFFVSMVPCILVQCTANYSLYEGWNFNSGNYLFTTDTK